MNAKKIVGSKSDHKKGKSKKRKQKISKYRSIRFDKERFFIVLVVGILSSAIGLWIIWATKSAPEDASHSIGSATAPKFAPVFPQSTLEILAFIGGNLFVLCGVICIFLCLKFVVRYTAGKFRN